MLLLTSTLALAIVHRADAYQTSTPPPWETEVLTPDKSDLTNPAKTVITRPTFLPGVEKSVPPPGGFTSGSQAARGATRFMSASGLLPMAARVVPWVGAGLFAIEACNAFLDGCFLFSGEHPAPAIDVTWGGPTWTATQLRGAEIPAGHYFTTAPGSFAEDHPCGQAVGLPPQPPEATAILVGTATFTAQCDGQTLNGTRVVAIRDVLAGMESFGLGADNPGIPNATGSNYCPSATATSGTGGNGSCSSNPPNDWSQRMAQMLRHDGANSAGLSYAQINGLGNAIAEEIAGGARVEIPDCDGMIFATCLDLLEQLGLEVQRDPLSWQGAHVDKPADAVIQLEPEKGSLVYPGTVITVVTNPTRMPLLVPELPEDPDTHWKVYRDELLEVGFPMPSIDVLTDANASPQHGPSAATAVEPEAGSAVNPITPPKPVIVANPPTVPPVGTGGGNCGTGNIRGINFGPLMGLNFGNVFPFGVFGWMVGVFEEWTVSPQPPAWTFKVGDTINWDVSLAFLSDTMDILRPIIVIVATLGFVWMLAASVLKIDRGDEA